MRPRAASLRRFAAKEKPMSAASPPPAPIATPWALFRRLMSIVAAVAAVTAALALLWLHNAGIALGPVLIAAVAGGIALSLLLGGALMGLVYVSARGGADDRAGNP